MPVAKASVKDCVMHTGHTHVYTRVREYHRAVFISRMCTGHIPFAHVAKLTGKETRYFARRFFFVDSPVNARCPAQNLLPSRNTSIKYISS